jgi:hypothetical protein
MGRTVMDEVDALVRAFGSRGKHDQSLWKLDVLLDLGRLDDPRVVPFLVGVVADADEPLDVRLEILERFREMSLTPGDRLRAAHACLAALAPDADSRLRLRASLVLGAFVDLDGVLDALGAVAAAECEPTELRYNAYASLQRAGPTSACLDILRVLRADEIFGQSVRALMASWGVS